LLVERLLNHARNPDGRLSVRGSTMTPHPDFK
jgi:hypothetical protein